MCVVYSTVTIPYMLYFITTCNVCRSARAPATLNADTRFFFFLSLKISLFSSTLCWIIVHYYTVGIIYILNASWLCINIMRLSTTAFEIRMHVLRWNYASHATTAKHLGLVSLRLWHLTDTSYLAPVLALSQTRVQQLQRFQIQFVFGSLDLWLF